MTDLLNYLRAPHLYSQGPDAPNRPRQMRPVDQRMRDPNSGVNTQAYGDFRTQAARGRYSLPLGPSAIASDAAPSANAPVGLFGDMGARAGRLANETRYSPRYRSSQTMTPFPMGPTAAASGPGPTTLAQEETGIPQEYLDSLIGHESGGDRFAKASTSSATGPAQFIDGTWLRMMRQYGGENGLPATASDQDVLGLRTNPSWASLMASRYTLENQTAMEGALHRPITEGEAYLGHFLGSGDATRLLKAPRGADARGFVSSSAASANPRIFYKPGGGPRTVQEVIDLQTQRFRGQMLPRQRPAGR